MCGAKGVRSRNGSILVLVLIMLVFTAAAVTGFIREAVLDLSQIAARTVRTDLRVHAYSALDSAVAVLAGFHRYDGALYRASQGWGDVLEMSDFTPPPGVSVSVEFVDESGKLPLAAADPTMVPLVFEALGFSQSEADDLTDAWFYWTLPGYTPMTYRMQALDGLGADLAYEPPGRMPASWTELRSIPLLAEVFFDEEGEPTEVYRRFREWVTLFPVNRINLNTASIEALTLFAGYDPVQIAALHGYLSPLNPDPRYPPPYLRSAGEATERFGIETRGVPVAAEIQLLRVRIEVVEGLRSFALEAVFDVRGAAAREGTTDGAAGTAGQATLRDQLQYPFAMMELREEDGSHISTRL